MIRAEKAKAECVTLLRFAFVGVSFSALFSVLSAMVINLAIAPPFWTNVVLFSLCIPPAFLAQKHFSFRAKTLRKNAFLLYAATQIGSVSLVSLVTTRYVTYDIRMDTLVIGVTVVLAAGMSFLVGRLVIFSHRD
ncbi:hypothetical protein [Roseovarius sp. EL26]|uniref:hypothetical protein n=1 Tax=Roseovarius sp. EL26 TaxID=2126672 RepID=UPI000EA2521B|nr:hypothetical protein [Roseovarius sp. EL26]